MPGTARTPHSPRSAFLRATVACALAITLLWLSPQAPFSESPLEWSEMSNTSMRATPPAAGMGTNGATRQDAQLRGKNTSRPVRTGRKAPLVAVAHVATLSALQTKIDWCRGPVYLKYATYPGLIAEHDYCGGAYRLGRHRIGALVRVIGPGVADGLSRVRSKKTVPKGSSFSVTTGMGSLVLQTCAGNRLLLAGLVRAR